MSKRKDKISIKNGRLKITVFEGDEKSGYILSAKELIHLITSITDTIKNKNQTEDEQK
jgi:hypothetical protein